MGVNPEDPITMPSIVMQLMNGKEALMFSKERSSWLMRLLHLNLLMIMIVTRRSWNKEDYLGNHGEYVPDDDEMRSPRGWKDSKHGNRG